MWLFVRGRAQQDTFVPPQTLTDHLLRAYTRARAHGVTIDNIEAIKSQVFTIPGTKHDLSNSGWESLAIGPDGGIYATPAMIGMPHMQAGHIHEGIEHVWRHSDVLQHIRRISVKDKPRRLDAPLQYLLGGGDIDHALHAHGTITGEDPYMPLYKNIALYLIAEHAGRSHVNGRVGIRCRMGEYLYECGPDSGPVMFTHSNCVQSLSTFDSHTLVNTFYSAAAQRTNDDIRNPVSYDEHEMAHIPQHLRVRSYGCGSPVMDCTLGPGDRLVDLGSGTGIECFIAAKKVGAHGAVYGIDMSPAMLQQAGEGQKRVADILGYDNMSFRHGLLESIPLEDDSVDFVISNCVINLTADKRTVFEEIMRILVPGGTLCISDIVRHTAIPLDMQYNERLRGECLAGAMHQEELFAVLEELGFTDAYLIRRYEYRRVRDYPFYAITYRARSPQKHTDRLLMYRGPYDAITVNDTTIRRGQTRTVSCCDEAVTDESFFELDGSGNVTNVAQTTSCGVFVSPQDTHSAPAPARKDTHPAGCMVCGSPLVYHPGHTGRTCHYCGRTMSTNAACEAGHFVCDDCHARDARSYLRHVCLHTTMSNPLALFLHVRAHPLFPLHGPEYHSLVPAVFLTAYKNSGGRVDTGALDAAIERGASVAGGSCAFLGMCGAAIGVGIAYALILGATPYTGDIRQRIQTITHDIMKEVAAYKGPRCCRRDGLIALQKGCVLSQRYLPVQVDCTGDCVCTQYADNPECSNTACPWWPQHR
jgi:ubiquinone/menaquinone biosynthesis C-methylase UbiE